MRASRLQLQFREVRKIRAARGTFSRHGATIQKNGLQIPQNAVFY
jgi:hypothetical protein